MDIQYGLPTLGQIQLFLRKVAGDDALYGIARQKMKLKEIPYKEDSSLKKEWDRFCAEETKNHEKIKDYENYSLNETANISNLFKGFLDDLNDDYDIPVEISSKIYDFCVMLYRFYEQFNFYANLNKMAQFNNHKINEYELGKYMFVAENKTANFVSFYLKINLMQMLKEACSRNFSKTIEFIKFYLSDDFSYKLLFDKLRQEKNCKSMDALCDVLDNKSEINPYKSFIKKSLKDDKNPSWLKLDSVLPFCSDKLKNKFIAKYLLSNCEAALQEVFQISKSEIEGIRKTLEDFSKSEVFSDKSITQFFKTMLTIEPFENERNPFCCENNGKASRAVAICCNFVFKKHIYKKAVKENSSSDFDKFIEGLVEFAPHSQAFFVPYFKAYVAVASRDFDKAMELFKTAFEFKQFAGDYLQPFLEMAFCFANYYKANWISVRKSIKKEDGVQNPISCDVKMFKNFGYAVDIFPDSAESSYFEAYNNLDYFYMFFPIECFIDEEQARKIQKQEYENQERNKIETGGRKKQKFVENHPYEVLFKLQGKERNKQISEKSLFTLNTDHNPKQKDLCPPLVLCIRYSLKDERLLGLAENWLSDAETQINTTAVSFDGSTALCEALKLYTYLKSHIYSENAEKIGNIPQESYKTIATNNYEEFDEEYQSELNKARKKFFRILDSYKLKIARYKRLAEQLIERTDWENELKFGERLPTLALAIKTYDYELVKKLAEKIPNEEFDDCKTNGIFSFVYAILQKEPVSFGVREYIRKQKDIHIPHFMGINRFGLTREEKTRNYEFENPLPEGIDYTKYHMFHEEEQFSEKDEYDFFSLYGDEQTFGEQVKEYDKIIDYFIDRTHDINVVAGTVNIWTRSFIRSDSDKKVDSFQAGVLNLTTLFIAGISNDADTCRKLLKKGAKTVLPKDKAGVFPDKFGETVFFLKNNFINMLIEHKSWETLVMFLTEFPEEAKHLLRNDEFGMNSFMCFAAKVQDYFIWTGRDKREWKPIVQWISDLFISCGANPDEKTKIGTARQYLERYGIKI